MSLEQAIDEALRDAAPPARDAAGGLTARQAEVLCLVARGRTDRQIAAALGLSAETVGRHLSRIYRTLGVTSRAAAAAVRHGLA
jgi:DNA-binding NarL/FixJ family response regulator